MTNLHIPVVLGTARQGRSSEQVANYIVSVIESRENMTTELVDVKDHIKVAVTIPSWGDDGADKKESKWKDIVEKSNALVLVVPEYNHGYPGELKLLLDSLFEHYKGLPVMIVGVSAGTLGGARVIDHIKPVLTEMYLTPIRESVTFSRVKNAFNDDGTIKDEKTTEYTNKVLDELTESAKIINQFRMD